MKLPELKEYFNSVTLPKEIRISDFEYIHDVRKFVDAHIEVLENHSGIRIYKPYFDRLVELKNKIEKCA